MSCEHDCTTPPVFPRVIANRPGLPRIGYRIGGYGEMRAHMLGLLDAAPALAAWTHRRPDDPGIALLESTAVVGDILSLYQDDYANESSLRTATLPDSVAALVRLLGYRPAPGLGGQARFALGVKGSAPVTVPAGLALQAPLAGAAQRATFETSAPAQAVPALSQFHLYRPRHVPPLRNGMDTFQLDASSDVTLKAGDTLMVGLAVGSADHRAYDHLQRLQVAEVWQAFGVRYVRTTGTLQTLVSAAFAAPGSAPGLSAAATPGAGASLAATGLPAVTTLATLPTLPTLPSLASLAPLAPLTPLATLPAAAAPAAGASVASVASLGSVAALPAFSGVLGAGLALPRLTAVPRLVAWKLAGEHRHFGHQAPATRVVVDANGRASEHAVPYERVLDSTQGSPAGPGIGARQLPLEGRVDRVVAGTTVLVQANLSTRSGRRALRQRLLSRRVTQVDAQSLAWGAQTGAATVLTLDADLAITEAGLRLNQADIRNIAVHAVEGEAFELRAEPVPTRAATGHTLDFYGNAADALALRQRSLLLAEPQGVVAASVQQVRRLSEGEPRFQLTLDRRLDYRLYGHDDAPVWVYGNLVSASEGKTEPASGAFHSPGSGPETVLGDGDARQAWQTFTLPKLSADTPLTHLLDPTQSPPQRPELQLRVAGLAWQRVDSFFDAGPLDEVYILRHDGQGGSFVQFGDGVHGRRLPSGQGNVTAVYRTGSGSRGRLAPDASVSVQPRFAGFDQAFLLEPVTGGAAPEAADSVRRAAPGAMQSLGRIVSLADVESEAQALPGVLKARAAWALVDASPVLTLTVLTEGSVAADHRSHHASGVDTDDDRERAALDAALRAAVAARGPARCALQLRLGQRRFVQLALRVGHDPRLRSAELLSALQLALGTTADDLTTDSALDDAATGGLFDWRARGFGQDVHGSQVLGRVQAVPGVAWVQLLRLADGRQHTPAGGASPAARVAASTRLACPADSVLALHQDQLSVEWIAA